MRNSRRYPDEDGWGKAPQSLAVAWYDTWRKYAADLTKNEKGFTWEWVKLTLDNALAPFDPLYSMMNPKVLAETMRTGGLNWWFAGMQHTLSYMRSGQPVLTDRSAFKVGENLALSPGQVVYRNDLFELIEYEPTTEDVYSIPTLLVPPEISKAYVVDLTPDLSLVKRMVDGGQHVFLMVWRNFHEVADYRFEDYALAVVIALCTVQSITKSHKANVMGFCAGGQTLTAAVAYLDAVGKGGMVNSVTTVVTQSDFRTEPGMMGLFDNPVLFQLALLMDSRGELIEGKQMAQTFVWLRSNQLVYDPWYNTLIGNDLSKDPVLAWNMDSTTMQPGLHSDFIRIAQNNGLVEGVEICGKVVSSKALGHFDTYTVGGKTDHITRWESVKASALSTQPDSNHSHTLVQTNTGHVQTIVLGDGKRMAIRAGELRSDWDEKAVTMPGISWVTDWLDWVSFRSGRTIPAHAVSDEIGIPAPGIYATE